MTLYRFHLILALLSLLVIGLALSNWYVTPEKALLWAVAVLSMFIMWVTVLIVGYFRPFHSLSNPERSFLTGSMIIGGLIIALSLTIKLVTTLSGQDLTTLRRAWGLGLGAILIITGNSMPKILSPLDAKGCGPHYTQAVKRFAGWSLVIAGFGYMIPWFFLPLKQAATISTLICFTGVALVIARCMIAMNRQKSAPPDL